MAERKVLVIIKSRPFTTLNYYEALRTAAGLWDHKLKVLWLNDGVYSAIDGNDKTFTGKFLSDLPDLDIESFVDGESLKGTGFVSSDLVKNATLVDDEKILAMLDEAEVTLVF
jgi:sulfur relay (sulfurtransferase) DsrF/TusC family protein